MVKRFWLIDLDNEELSMEIMSSNPRDAALKAATREVAQICLVETENGKLHLFHGSKVPLEPRETNEFTRKNNITSKPIVGKLGYVNMQKKMSRSDMPTILVEFKRLTS